MMTGLRAARVMAVKVMAVHELGREAKWNYHLMST